MAQNINNPIYRDRRLSLLVPMVLLWSLVVLAGLGFLWWENDTIDSLEGFYLIPWAILAGLVIVAPSVYLFFKGKFDLFHPLTFAAWSYVFPAMVLGGVILSFGWSDPYFFSFIEDPHYNLPLTLVYVALGFFGLTVGYFLPIGKFIVNKLEPRMPKWQWESSKIWLPGIMLMLTGVGFNILGFIQGLLGYQRAAEINIFDGLLFFLLILLNEGNILLWLAIFHTRKKTGIYYIVLVILILFLPFRMALLGSRSSLLISIIPIAMAFQYSGRRLKWQHSVIFGAVMTIAIGIGVVYGTSFRNIKGSEARVNAGDYVGQIFATVDYLSTEDTMIVVEQSAQALAARVENLSSLGVVVSNYEKLAPYEASYGLENNIINDSLTSFVPRFVWADKPPTSDARAYSALYFDYGENSFAITPFGDLLRNFGVPGIFLGMLVLGIYLKLIYGLLIETPNPSIWKNVAYYPLLTLVSYEAFYATIFPSFLRTLVVLAISLFLVNFLVKKQRGQSAR